MQATSCSRERGGLASYPTSYVSFARQLVQELVQLLLVERFDRDGACPLGVGKGGQLGRNRDDVRRQEDHQLALVLVGDLPLEEIPQDRDIPQEGNLAVEFSDLVVWMRPPMITVWPSGVTTTVSAERMSMTGVLMIVPLALAEMGMETVGSSWEIWGESIISTSPSSVMKGVTFRMTPTSV